MAAFGNQLDYLGVIILMWGSTIPTVYYGFYCDPDLQKLYWIMVSIWICWNFWPLSMTVSMQISSLALACAITTLNPEFRQSTYRPFRAAMFSCLGLSAIVFIVHGLLRHGWVTQNRRMSLDWMAVVAILNLVGASVYAARVGLVL